MLFLINAFYLYINLKIFKIPQRKKKLINIRTKFSKNIPDVYIDLSSHLKNSLAEDLGNYDYNNSYLRSTSIEDSSVPNDNVLFML